jgi:hypothetical protein
MTPTGDSQVSQSSRPDTEIPPQSHPDGGDVDFLKMAQLIVLNNIFPQPSTKYGEVTNETRRTNAENGSTDDTSGDVIHAKPAQRRFDWFWLLTHLGGLLLPPMTLHYSIAFHE